MVTALSTTFTLAGTPPADSCIVNGTFSGEDGHWLIICKANENPLNQGRIVPLEGNDFRFKLDRRYDEAYMLVLAGNAANGVPSSPLLFFAEDSVTIALRTGSHPEGNRIEGGPLNQEYRRFQKTVASLYREPSSRLQAAVDAGELGPAEAATEDSRLLAEMRRWLADYIANQVGPVSHYLLAMLMSSEDEWDLATLASLHPTYAEHFPDHPYTEAIANFYRVKDAIEEKKRFIDVEAEDLMGNRTRVRDLLAPKVTLINFWASWCGACIKKTRTMIPVYERYKEHGFDIINVAAERTDTESLKRLLQRENQPWKTNLGEKPMDPSSRK